MISVYQSSGEQQYISNYRVFQKECQKLKDCENLNFYINLVFSAVLGPELADILSPTASRSTIITPRHP